MADFTSATLNVPGLDIDGGSVEIAALTDWLVVCITIGRKEIGRKSANPSALVALALRAGSATGSAA